MDIPDEIFLCIIYFCEISELMSFAKTCKKYCYIVETQVDYKCFLPIYVRKKYPIVDLNFFKNNWFVMSKGNKGITLAWFLLYDFLNTRKLDNIKTDMAEIIFISNGIHFVIKITSGQNFENDLYQFRSKKNNSYFVVNLDKNDVVNKLKEMIMIHCLTDIKIRYEHTIKDYAKIKELTIYNVS